MSRRVVVLRPEPGNARTAADLAALGVEGVRLPLFAVVPIVWMPPDPARYDALLLTSANAPRHAGPGLAALAHLPVVAVGAETAAAAHECGLRVALTGGEGVDAALALAKATGFARLLHLAGRDHIVANAIDAVIVYASDAIDAPLDAAVIEGTVVLLHSTRAARHFAELADRAGLDRATIRLAAISEGVGIAAGGGWEMSRAAASPDRLVELAADLAIDRPPGAGDKAA